MLSIREADQFYDRDDQLGSSGDLGLEARPNGIVIDKTRGASRQKMPLGSSGNTQNIQNIGGGHLYMPETFNGDED